MASNGQTPKAPPNPSPLRNAKFFQANMRILVTGRAGFFGSHLVDRLMPNEKNEANLLAVQLPGTQTRSFCYVSDMVDGLIRLMEGINTGPINIGNPGEFTILELAETVKEIINPNVEIVTVENTPDSPRQRKPDITKAKQLLCWEPKVKLRDGIPLMEENFRQRLGVPKSTQARERFKNLLNKI